MNGLRSGLKVLYRLGRAIRRRRDRWLDALDGGSRQKQQAVEKARQRQNWRQTARARAQANAEALESNPLVISRLEETIAARIGRPVRHLRSEPVLRPASGARAHAHRRAYTKHWFEVSGAVDAKLTALLDADRLLVVFLKSGSKLGLCAPLEYILSDQGGKGFRAPYFFGSFTISDLKFAAWEAIRTKRRPFKTYSLGDQTRIVEAIAAANAVPAGGTVPVQARWVYAKPPGWFESIYRVMDGTAHARWKDLYATTMEVMGHHDRLVRRLWSTDAICLTHNDLRVAGNIFVPPAGDVVVFDWEVASLSVPGADLGVLSRTETGPDLLSCYLARMAQHGFKLDSAAVRFALEVVEGHRCVLTGWRRGDEDQVETGLALLTRHLD